MVCDLIVTQYRAVQKLFSDRYDDVGAAGAAVPMRWQEVLKKRRSASRKRSSISDKPQPRFALHRSVRLASTSTCALAAAVLMHVVARVYVWVCMLFGTGASAVQLAASGLADLQGLDQCSGYTNMYTCVCSESVFFVSTDRAVSLVCFSSQLLHN